jgi:hypothetical protein
MPVRFSNNASTTLNGAVSSSVTSIVVNDASEFPTLSSGEYTYLTLANAAETKIEIIKITAINTSTKTLTVDTDGSTPPLPIGRGQDGTGAQAFSSGDICELRMTAALLNDAASQDDDPSGTAVAMAIALG